jgi:hypothetical protein
MEELKPCVKNICLASMMWEMVPEARHFGLPDVIFSSSAFLDIPWHLLVFLSASWHSTSSFAGHCVLILRENLEIFTVAEETCRRLSAASISLGVVCFALKRRASS